MTHYLPVTPFVEMPISLTVKHFGDSPYSKQYPEMPYVQTCLPSCGDLGIPVYDECNISNTGGNNNNSNNTVFSCSRDNGYSQLLEVDNSQMETRGEKRVSCLRYGQIIHSPSLQIDGLRYESQEKKLDPYSPLCLVPLPGHVLEPSFIRRRNERERERVRCVNEGYDRLKEHLPLDNKDRRISKVETLRGAIKYIRQLRQMLDDTDDKERKDTSGCCPDSKFVSEKRRQRSSLTSSDPGSPDSEY